MGCEYPVQLLVVFPSNQDPELLVGSSGGSVFRFSLKSLIEYYDLKLAKGGYERMNYNPLRNAKEDYASQADKNKKEPLSIPTFLQNNFQQVVLRKQFSIFRYSTS